MPTKEEVLESMDVVILTKAMATVKAAEYGLKRAFTVVQAQCGYTHTEEMLGFEGVQLMLCNNTKHPYAHSIYSTCCAKDCPYGLI